MLWRLSLKLRRPSAGLFNSNGMNLFNHLVVELFDARTRLAWKASSEDSTDLSDHEILMDFISKRTYTLNAAKSKITTKASWEPAKSTKTHFTEHASNFSQCALCKNKHTLTHYTLKQNRLTNGSLVLYWNQLTVFQLFWKSLCRAVSITTKLLNVQNPTLLDALRRVCSSKDVQIRCPLLSCWRQQSNSPSYRASECGRPP